VLDHGFNNQIAIGQVFPPRGALQPGTNSLRRILERALFGQLGHRFFNSGKALVQILLLHFQHGDVESRGRGYLRDPRAHQPATQNTDFSDLHKQSFLTTEDTKEYREKRIHKYQDPCANRAARDRVLQTFYDYRDALPAADARRRQPILLFSPPQLVKQGDDKPRSGRAQRMAQSNGPAIHVHLVTVQDQFLLHPQVLRRERFIHFHQVNVIELQAGFLKCKAYSRHRSAAHQLGLHSGDAPADQTSQRLEPALLRFLERQHHYRRAAVHDSAGVSRRHRAVLAEGRAQLGQTLQGAVGAPVVVFTEHLAAQVAALVLELHRHDFFLQASGLVRRIRQLLRAQRKFVL